MEKCCPCALATVALGIRRALPVHFPSSSAQYVLSRHYSIAWVMSFKWTCQGQSFTAVTQQAESLLLAENVPRFFFPWKYRDQNAHAIHTMSIHSTPLCLAPYGGPALLAPVWPHFWGRSGRIREIGRASSKERDKISVEAVS